MDSRLRDVMNGGEDNYLLPFLWMHDGNGGTLAAQVQRVYESGARALCVESRPHEGFCGDEWWSDMREICDEAKKLGMKVWILDDKHFPTGFANHLIPKKYPERRKWQLTEHHADMMGPMANASLLMPELKDDDQLIGIVAYPRKDTEENLIDAPIDLTANAKGRFLYWDVPEGCWRVFYFVKTRRGCRQHEVDYIHLIDRESVGVLIEAVYDEHYEKLGPYFGETIVGFFSDEPSLGNDFFRHGVTNNGIYSMKIGMVGVALTWSDELLGRMIDAEGAGIALRLAGLWYELGERSASLRYLYMDQLTQLFRDHFSYQLGDWCRKHGVMYIGHIIEDMNCHGRLGYSGGHYFRSLEGQDMAGIDIVLHQILPGFGAYKTACIGSGGVADPEFYHYVLAKLAASLSHIKPEMQGRAMCEVFGAYGWAEGAPMMKWLMDHLLVRGVNYFVPHAFSPKFPDPDCPPHFGAAGKDPQFAGFTKLMGYINRAAHLLTGGTHVASAAILYHAESEWMNIDDCMLTQQPAKALYDAHIDYDIVPMDALTNDAQVEDKKLLIGGASYDCLVIPRAPRLPDALIMALNALQRDGLKLFYVEGAPIGAQNANIVKLDALAQALKSNGIYDVRVDGEYRMLRIYHVRQDDRNLFMLFNESITDAVQTIVRFPCAGTAVKVNALDEIYEAVAADNGYVEIALLPYESIMYVFGADADGFAAEAHYVQGEVLPEAYDIALSTMAAYPKFKSFKKKAPLTNITGGCGDPDFSGVMRYQMSVDLQGELPRGIDLGMVGQTANLTLNGVDLGLRICPPYRYNVEGAVREGENELLIEVRNTLVHEVKDVFSTFVQIPPSGLMGPVRWLK